MITRLQVKNFRSFAEIDVNLGPLTVLVGRNGAGKSSLVDSLRFVRDALQIGLQGAIDARHGLVALRRWAPRKPFNIEISIVVQASSFWGDYGFTISSGKDGAYKVIRESCKVGRQPDSPTDGFEIRGGEWITSPNRLRASSTRLDRSYDPSSLTLSNLYIFSPLFSKLRLELLNSHFYSIFPNTLRLPQKPSNEKMLLDQGENFAVIVRRLRENKTQFRKLLSALSTVVEGVSDLRVRQVGGYLVTELKHEYSRGFFEPGTSTWFELDQESDGTLRLLGILVALYQTTSHRGRMLAIEEPESSLHPGALGVLSDVLYEQSKRRQVLVTTQSPDLISHFNVGELLVVQKDSGTSRVGIIDETQRRAVEQELFTTGDLLRMEGLRRKED